MRTHQRAENHAGPTPIALPALRRDNPVAAGQGGSTTLHYTVGAGHDFSRMRVHGDQDAGSWLNDAGHQSRQVKGTESFPEEEGQAGDPELKRLDNGSGTGSGSGSGSGSGAGSGSGSAKAAAPTLAASGDTYKDGASESHKSIRFDVTVPSGLTAGDYALVNMVKGSMKNGDGKYFKATMYGKQVDANYADWVVDSRDEDPVYWSTDKARWNFRTTSTGFFATDDPGPALTSETGAIYALKFKMGLYKLADLPTTTTGTISATPLAEYPWQYSVVVDKSGKFSHPAI